MEEVLRRIAEKIQKERAQQADLDALRHRLATSARYAQERLLLQLLEGIEPETLLHQAQDLDMGLKAPQYLVMLLGKMPAKARLSLQGILQRLSEGIGGTMYQTLVEGSPALVVLGESQTDIEERAYALAQALAHEAAQSGMETPTVAIGAPVSQLAQLPQALSSARAVLGSMQGQPRRIVGSMDVALSMPAGLMEGAIPPLYERLRYAAQPEGAQVVEETFASLGDMTPPSLLVMHYLLVDMLLAATRIIRQCGGEPSQVLPTHLTQQGELLRLAKSPEDALAAGKEIVSAALAFRDQNAFSRYGEILRKACAYIEENYHLPEITLHDVAHHVALSNNHFCTVFSQEMGQTFIEYLTALRMERAKALLRTTDARSSEIAVLVGYNDPHYFSYLFKRQAGTSPRDYRKEEKTRMERRETRLD